MRVLLLLLAVAAALPVCAAVTTFQTPAQGIMPSWNLIGPPGIPLDPVPQHFFGTQAWIDARLFRHDAATQSQVMYDWWAPEWFGNILVTDGYYYAVDAQGSISFQGLDDTDQMDMCISLPREQWVCFSTPFSKNFPWEKAKVSDGIRMYTIKEAEDANMNWMANLAFGWDSATQSGFDVSLPEHWPSTHFLEPWHGYWISTGSTPVTLILECENLVDPAPPGPPGPPTPPGPQ